MECTVRFQRLLGEGEPAAGRAEVLPTVYLRELRPRHGFLPQRSQQGLWDSRDSKLDSDSRVLLNIIMESFSITLNLRLCLVLLPGCLHVRKQFTHIWPHSVDREVQDRTSSQ